MTEDIIQYTLFTFSSIMILVNPLGAMLFYNSLTCNVDTQTRLRIAAYSCQLSAVILIFFTISGSGLLSLFGITIDAFTIAGGVLLFGIGIEMVNARTSRVKMTATEKYESIDADELSSMPLAVPMIAGPGTITTVIVLTKDLQPVTHPLHYGIIIGSIFITLLITYILFRFAEKISNLIGQREYRIINRLMGIILMAIAVQFMLNGISDAFPSLIR